MVKLWKRTGLCLFLACFFWCGTLLADRMTLNDNIIRLHVVANSDDEQDQNIKLKVRDAVVASIRSDLLNVTDVTAAKAYLQENLPRIEAAAKEVLKRAGVGEAITVSLCKEAFGTRIYDTFTLPAGIYEALRITIGEGEGKNWWCVVFPSLCIPATTDGVEDIAAGAGFSETLNKTLTGKSGCELRFFLLDKLGELENKFFRE